MSVLAAILIITGLIFFAGGSIGIIRFPDFYTRLHAAGKLDTMGVFMCLLGMAVYALHDFSVGAVITCLKIILIIAFVFITSPTATHAIIDAGVRAGMEPWTKEAGAPAPPSAPDQD